MNYGDGRKQVIDVLMWERTAIIASRSFSKLSKYNLLPHFHDEKIGALGKERIKKATKKQGPLDMENTKETKQERKITEKRLMG